MKLNSNKIKIVAISDTHGMNFAPKIPECDILLIAGDISPNWLSHSYYTQKMWFETDFIEQLKQLTNIAKHIVFIGGNHDTYLSEVNNKNENHIIRGQLPPNIYYLCDDLVEIMGLRIYGSPWCNIPTWGVKGPPVWNFALNDKELAKKYSKIPKDIDILLTHGPAFGFCDVILDNGVNEQNLKIWNTRPDHLGSKALFEIIKSNKTTPKYVISGHIHSAERNFVVHKNTIDDFGTKFACVSILNEEYKFSDLQSPLIIIIKDEIEEK